MTTPYDFQPLSEGDRFSASQWTDHLMPQMHRSDTPDEGLVDSLGTIHASYSKPQATETFRWGKLDDALAAGLTATVSLWQGTDGDWAKWDQDSDDDWDNCYAPPLMTAGTIAADKWVLVRDFGTRKVIIAHEC